MKLYLIEMFVVSLLVTLVIELLIAAMFRIPFGKNWLPVILVNILTNPTTVLVYLLITLYVPQISGIKGQIPLECLVIIVEYAIYKSFSKGGWCCKKPLLLALSSNVVSWLMGILISGS